MWHATWQELHSQQLPRGQSHATSAFLWGHGPFSNNFFLVEIFFKLFFYRDENQNSPELQGRK